jgi:hypothetical protein
MKRTCQRIWREDAGGLSFEWVLIITLLVIGTVGGLAAVRDALISEMGDAAEAAVTLDQSYNVGVSKKHGLGAAFSYTDTKPLIEVTRQDGTTRQTVGNLSCPP